MYSSTPRHEYSRRITSEKWGRSKMTQIPMWDAPVQRSKVVDIDLDRHHKPMYPTGVFQPKYGIPGTGKGNRDWRPEDIERERLQQDAFSAAYFEHHPGEQYGPLWRCPESFINAYKMPAGRRNDLMERDPWINGVHENRMMNAPNTDPMTTARSQHGEVGGYANDANVVISAQHEPASANPYGFFAAIRSGPTRGETTTTSHAESDPTMQKVCVEPRAMQSMSSFVPVVQSGHEVENTSVLPWLAPKRMDHHEDRVDTFADRTTSTPTIHSYRQEMHKHIPTVPTSSQTYGTHRPSQATTGQGWVRYTGPTVRYEGHVHPCAFAYSSR